MDIIKEIKDLADKKNAIILAHNYQPGEIQDVAHFSGDSLELSRIAAGQSKNGPGDHDIIVFCGVHFMAEAAYILSPEKKVLLPVLDAGCPMADMAAPENLQKMKDKHPDAKVVTYINSTAAVKALSDVICTSSNAIDIVQKIDADKIIFVPDKNLGSYVQRFTDKELILWDGYCPTHNMFIKDHLLEMKEKYPHAVLMVHPECSPEIIDIADEVFSTGKMVSFVKNTKAKQILVGTEVGMIHRLKKEAPDIEYILAHEKFICQDMKKIGLKNLLDSLKNEEHSIKVNDEVRIKAQNALDMMLELSN